MSEQRRWIRFFVQSYRYDSLYRLTEAKEKSGSTTNWTQRWNYDRYGNRLGFTQNIVGNTNAPNPTIDANTNRFTTGQGFTYDKNGNVVGDVDAASSLPRTFVFNGDNKQIEVKKDGVTAGRYYYDGEGKRVKKVTDAETTVFVYSGGKLIAEYSTATTQNPTIAYTTTDHLGSPRIITDGVGQVKSRRDFMPFGEDIFVNVGGRTPALQYNSTTDDIRQKFTGYQKDSETQLDFAEARMYANNYGRFTAVDPLLASGKSANPQSFNRYIYVGNNPIVVTDPMGLDWYRNGNKFQWSADNKVWDDGTAIDKDWSPVQFDSTGYYGYPCEGCAPGTKHYLYQIGGHDNGRRAQIYDSLMEHVRLANSFNDPKYLAVRNPQVRDAASDVMWSGAAILNKPSETYNFAAWGANKFGFNLPYAPTLEPDENTPALAKGFYYGMTGALVVQGGVSAFRGVFGSANAARTRSSLATMEDAFNAAGQVRNIAGYEVGGTFGRVGSTYNANIWGLYKTESSSGMFSFMKALQAEVRASGASQLNIVGTKIRNTNFLNSANINRASRFGFNYRQINSETILFSGPLK